MKPEHVMFWQEKGKKNLLHLVLKLTILLISGLPFFLWRERADIKIGSNGNKETV